MKNPRILLALMLLLAGGLVVLLGAAPPASAADGCTAAASYSNNQRTLVINCTNASGAYSYQPSLLCGTSAVRYYGSRIMQGVSTAKCPAGAADRGSYWSSPQATTAVTTANSSGICDVGLDREQRYSPEMGWVTTREGTKATCPTSMSQATWYRAVVRCSISGSTVYGPWVARGVKSQAWCAPDYSGYGGAERASTHYAQYRR